VKRTIVKINKMDCPSEIKMIESQFERLDDNIKLEFDLNERKVTFYHNIKDEIILKSLKGISLPGTIISTNDIEEFEIPDIAPSVEARTLKYLLLINFTMFVIEVTLGIYAQSSGLLADGLDMLADSLVYGVSLYAVGKAINIKNKAAYMSGIMQISLGVVCLIEVGRKFYFGSEPISNIMIITSIMALIANVFCLFLIHKHKDGEIHMKASWIFSANDVIVNLGVIYSGTFVYFLNSNIPDLAVGALVSIIVIRGGFAIIKMTRGKRMAVGYCGASGNGC
tara:strand:- start:1243 stop:2085 length:843 start_codon:yes stop_codon:yes gene_type:complete